MKFIITFIWAFILSHVVTYIIGSITGSPYDVQTASILGIGFSILLFLIGTITSTADPSEV